MKKECNIIKKERKTCNGKGMKEREKCQAERMKCDREREMERKKGRNILEK